MDEMCEGKNFSFLLAEEETRSFWSTINASKTLLERTENRPEYIIYDDPPFATGLPPYGHIVAGTIKDIVSRYQQMTGHHVNRRFGWHCHGLPVESETDRINKTNRVDGILDIAVYNESCSAIATRYVKEWEKVITRTGGRSDFSQDYKTMELKCMESVWLVFDQLYNKGLVYKGFKVLPYCTRCKTPISNFEVGESYKYVADPEVYVTFRIMDDQDKAAFVVRTTSPWTLPSNLALCVNANLGYVKVRSKINEKFYVVAESCVSALPAPKHAKASRSPEFYEVMEHIKGESLVGKKYEPLFEYFKEFSSKAFKVLADGYVNGASGTGIVHCAPAFGEDDYRVCLDNKIIEEGEGLVVAVDDDGLFTERITHFSGLYVKDADKLIIGAVEDKGRLLKSGSFTHSYPFCCHSDTPLIYRAVPSWFVDVKKLENKLLENNEDTHWVPGHMKENFTSWLKNPKDWAISRSRFWGTPLPIWISKDGKEIVVVNSVEKLAQLSGVKANKLLVTGLHHPYLDEIVIPSSRGKGFGDLSHVKDVFDCLFESGSMHYAYYYSFEKEKLFDKNFVGDFVAEGPDQTRGLFYSLMVLSTALFEKPAFEKLICTGRVLAENGTRMAKKGKKFPKPLEVIDKYGADALRLYLVNSPVVRGEPLRFKTKGVHGVVKDVFLPWYNACRFLVQNAKRLEIQYGPFVPTDLATLPSLNILDQWIQSATQSLVKYVCEEMKEYRFHTVVPYLLKFLDNLTNIYVRLNRKRLKGRTGKDDCQTALSTLDNVLLTSCKVMAPFTPFFTETLYRNLRKVCAGSEESIHYCSFPEVGLIDGRIEKSVERMRTIIDLARKIRERHRLPLKTPLKEIIVVHSDAKLLDEITGELREYVLEELNVMSFVACHHIQKYASLKAEPNFSVLGERLKKSMNLVANQVKDMSEDDILKFQETGEVTFSGQKLERKDIKIGKVFKLPDGLTNKEIDAALGTDDVLVVLDLQEHGSLYESGVAREIVQRIQKLRKGSQERTESVVVYIESLDEKEFALQQVFTSQEQYISKSIGSPFLQATSKPKNAEVIMSKNFRDKSKLSYKITLAKPS